MYPQQADSKCTRCCPFLLGLRVQSGASHPQRVLFICLRMFCMSCPSGLILLLHFVQKTRNCNYFHNTLFQDPTWTFDYALSSFVVGAGPMPWRIPPQTWLCSLSTQWVWHRDLVAFKVPPTGSLENVFLCHRPGSLGLLQAPVLTWPTYRTFWTQQVEAPGEFRPALLTLAEPVRVC